MKEPATLELEIMFKDGSIRTMPFATIWKTTAFHVGELGQHYD
jgi:hypothetical protein